jgi:hypothetical protein
MSNSFEIRREDRRGGGRYVALVDGHEAELTYSRAEENLLVVDHTGVPSALGGRGIGQALVERAVMDARAEGTRILPVCSFVRVQLARHPEWQDVLAS